MDIRVLGEVTLSGSDGTYRLDIDPNLVDYRRFQRYTRAARSHAMAGNHRAAAAQYRQAIGEWTGQPLAGADRAGIDGLRVNLQEQHRVNALPGLGYVHRMLGDHEQAGDHHGRALRIAQAIGHRGGEMQALTGLGHVHSTSKPAATGNTP